MDENIGYYNILVGQRVKYIRKNHNLTQKQFAISIGIKQSTLSQIESGKIGLSVNLSAKIAELYNVTVDWISTGRDGISYNYKDKKIEYIVTPKAINTNRKTTPDLNFLIVNNIAFLDSFLLDIFHLLLFHIEKLRGEEFTDKEIDDMIGEEKKFKEQLPESSDLNELRNLYKIPDTDKIRLLCDILNVQRSVALKIIRLIEML